jgi:short-subunit dehydrogenase
LAGETREHGIYVFCLNPGSVETGIWSTSVNSEAGRRWLPDYEPVWVPPERAAHSVVQLASGVADGLTGRYTSIEDDLAELATRADDIRSRDVLQLRLVT